MKHSAVFQGLGRLKRVAKAFFKQVILDLLVGLELLAFLPILAIRALCVNPPLQMPLSGSQSLKLTHTSPPLFCLLL